MVNQGEDVVKSETGALKCHSALRLLVNILSEMIFPGYDNPCNHPFQYYLDVIVVYNISMRQSELDGEAGVGGERSPHQKVLKRFFYKMIIKYSKVQALAVKSSEHTKVNLS